jgi:hypothetical protein
MNADDESVLLRKLWECARRNNDEIIAAYLNIANAGPEIPFIKILVAMVQSLSEQLFAFKRVAMNAGSACLACGGRGVLRALGNWDYVCTYCRMPCSDEFLQKRLETLKALDEKDWKRLDELTRSTSLPPAVLEHNEAVKKMGNEASGDDP